MFRFLSWMVDILVSLYPISVVFGIVLVCLYALANTFASSRYFARCPKFMRRVIFWTVGVSSVWGPKCILFFILTSLALQLISFVTQQ